MAPALFPESDQNEPESEVRAVVQVARPDASEVSTLLSPGVPPVIFTCQPTSRVAPGLAVQIPIFPQALYIPVPTRQEVPL